MKISVSDRLVSIFSAPPCRVLMETRSPIVPGKPSVAVDSSSRVRLASTAISQCDVQNGVSITSDVRSDSSFTSASIVLSRVSVSFTSSFTVLFKRLILTLLISSLNGA